MAQSVIKQDRILIRTAQGESNNYGYAEVSRTSGYRIVSIYPTTVGIYATNYNATNTTLKFQTVDAGGAVQKNTHIEFVVFEAPA